MSNTFQRSIKRLLLSTLLLIIISACGQKGPLRLPNDSENQKIQPSNSYAHDDMPKHAYVYPTLE